MIIESFFGSLKKANEAVSKLKEDGFTDSFVDMREPVPGHGNAEANVVGTATAVSMSSLVLESDGDSFTRDKGPLTAASPMASGYGRFEEITDFNFKVTVETKEGKADQVKSIITEMGGSLEDPNVITQERLADMNIDYLPTQDAEGRRV